MTAFAKSSSPEAFSGLLSSPPSTAKVMLMESLSNSVGFRLTRTPLDRVSWVTPKSVVSVRAVTLPGSPNL